MVDVIQELGHLTKLAREEPAKRFNRLYRLLRQPEFLMLAKAKVEGNKGANTPGVDGQVMTDVTPAAIVKLSQELTDRHVSATTCTTGLHPEERQHAASDVL